MLGDFLRESRSEGVVQSAWRIFGADGRTAFKENGVTLGNGLSYIGFLPVKSCTLSLDNLITL